MTLWTIERPDGTLCFEDFRPSEKEAWSSFMSTVMNCIDAWHENKGIKENLFEFLGMTWREYRGWGQQTRTIEEIIADRSIT